MSLSPEEEIELEALLLTERADLAKDSLHEFIQQAWPLIEPDVIFSDSWHIEAICEHLEAISSGEIKNLLINMPPRFSKSTIVSVVWPSWEWISKASTKWIYASYAQKLSTRDSVKCRRIIESSWYKTNFGSKFKIVTDQNEKIRFDNNIGGYRIATSIGGTVTGEGADRLVVDDPHKVDEAYSDTVRQSTIDWYKEVFSTRVNDPKTTSKVIVMQRVHMNDLSGVLLEQGNYCHLCLPIKFEGKKYINSYGWEDPRKEIGEPLWPGRWDDEEIRNSVIELGTLGARAQLYQDPAPAEGNIMNPKWWKFYTQKPTGCKKIIQSWDLNFKEGVSSSLVCGQVWGLEGANKYLLDLWKGNIGFTESLNQIRLMKAKWPNTDEIIIEDKANGPAVIETLKNEISGIIPYCPDKDKTSRIISISPQIEAGNVWLPHQSIAWFNVEEFVYRCSCFPSCKIKDDIDAMSQALIRLKTFGVVSFTANDISMKDTNNKFFGSLSQSNW